MKNKRKFLACLVGLGGLGLASSASAVIHDVTVDGPDAIFLAGRTDVVIPTPDMAWTGPGTHLVRHGGATPEEAMESLPPFISVAGGDVVKVLDPADGGINFFNGFGPAFFGPEGDTGGTSELTALDGISGYIGTLGALAGVFLDDSIPSTGPAPATLDFSTAISRDFLSLSPLLGQVFFIGDGETSGGTAQEFVAPVGATRLFFGIPDGFGFDGPPGAYDDNDGAYRIRVGINEDPRNPSGVPEPLTAGLTGMALSALAFSVRRR